MTTKTVTAVWNLNEEIYECNGWFSLDGDEWFYENGTLVDDPEFMDGRTIIRFCEGPRNGEEVA